MSTTDLLFYSFIACIVSAAIGGWIARVSDRQETRGNILGFFLGPIGWILAACTGPRRRAE
jgi:uncharacterized membrane protein YeaQ/YmgE (transglycosylase-associated protein family)